MALLVPFWLVIRVGTYRKNHFLAFSLAFWKKLSPKNTRFSAFFRIKLIITAKLLVLGHVNLGFSGRQFIKTFNYHNLDSLKCSELQYWILDSLVLKMYMEPWNVSYISAKTWGNVGDMNYCVIEKGWNFHSPVRKFCIFSFGDEFLRHN